jgi:predicted acyltransferase
VSETATRSRLLALDVFRGVTIAAMILVNNPGSWNAMYAPLRHASWHGCTPTDLVFPFFLFAVGVSIPLALDRRVADGAGLGQIRRHILWRAAALVAIGIGLAAYPFVTFVPEFGWHRDLTGVRFPGVLQRIGVCYAVVALLYLSLSPRRLATFAVACLIGYWVVQRFVPVPSTGAVYAIDRQGDDLGAWLDHAVFGLHVWKKAPPFDPEGLLSTIPAFATTWFGVWTGSLLRSTAPIAEKIARIAVRGVVLVAAGWCAGLAFPINKPLWTSSYAMFTGGQAMLTLVVCLWVVDVRGHRRFAQPFVVYGVNALLVFVGSSVLSQTVRMIEVDGSDGRPIRLATWIHDELFASWLAPNAASLGYSIVWVLGWYVVLRWLHRRGIVWKL